MAESVGLGTPVAPASGIAPRVQADTAPASVRPRDERTSDEAPPSEESTQLALGTVVAAIVRSPAGKGPVAGARLLLRIVAPGAADPNLVTGTVRDVAINETLVATPIGLLALQRRLAFAPGTTIAFVVIDTTGPSAEAAPRPARSGGWLALEETLLALLGAAPALAERLRAELTPASGPQLAGTLLYLLGALYQGKWPEPAIAKALEETGDVRLPNRLAEDIAALRRLSEDATTGEWRVLTLPLLLGNFPLAVRLYLSRRQPRAENGIRFAIEIELSHLGPLQLDGLLRDKRLILVLRSHRDLGRALRQEMRGVFQRALATSGLDGDLSFATVASFLVRPLDTLRDRIEIIA